MTPPPKYPVPWLRYALWLLLLAGIAAAEKATMSNRGLVDLLAFTATCTVLVGVPVLAWLDRGRRRANRAIAQQATEAAVLQVSAVEAGTGD